MANSVDKKVKIVRMLVGVKDLRIAPQQVCKVTPKLAKVLEGLKEKQDYEIIE